MTDVYIVQYGVHDQDVDCFDSVWTSMEDAANYCEQSAQDMFDDNIDYVNDGWTYERVYGTHGVKVIIFNQYDEEVEWWSTTTAPLRDRYC